MTQGKKIPETVWKQFLEHLKEHFGSVSTVCRALNIERRSYYNKRLRDPSFAQEADLIFDRVQVPIAEEMLRMAVNKQESWAIRYTLDRTSRKWHPKLSSENIYDFEQRLFYVEEELRRKKKLSDDPPDDRPAFEE